jgi:hypothetical protein
MFMCNLAFIDQPEWKSVLEAVAVANVGTLLVCCPAAMVGPLQVSGGR